MNQKLIINADDYGMSPLFDKAIRELANTGIITSTTVLVDKKIDPAPLLDLENISIGLHLNIKESTSPEDQIEQQISIFGELFSFLPSHLDGHRHCHIDPNNISAVVKIAKKYNLTVRSRFSEDRKVFQKNNIPTPDSFISWHPRRKHLLFQKLKNKQRGITELVCHPGYYDKDCAYPYNERREEELNILKSKEFSCAIQKFQQANYSNASCSPRKKKVEIPFKKVYNRFGIL